MFADQSPPPYSAVVETAESPEPPNSTLPFAQADQLVSKVRALVPEGHVLYSRFSNVRDVASTGARFEYQETALVLFQRFGALIWESRNIASITLVAVKDFNEIILEFLSEPNTALRDRLKEMGNAFKLLQRERVSVTRYMSSFEALIKETEDFYRMISAPPVSLIRKRRKPSQSGRGGRGTRPLRKVKYPTAISRSDDSRSEPLECFSKVTSSIGVISRTCVDYALRFERIAEAAVFPSCVESAPQPRDNTPAEPNLNANPAPEYMPPSTPGSIENPEPAALTGLVSELVGDVRAFANQLDVFNAILAELSREHDIFVVYLKGGQSVADQGYRSEINRLRKQLPPVCSALDAYTKTTPL